MSNSLDENSQSLVTDNEQPQRSSPTRVAADQSDFELTERSQAFLDVMEQVDRVSNTNLPVLLIGERGTGRQLVACAIHQRSPRSGKPFIAVHCNAMPAGSIETELFGSGPDQPGVWQRVDGGTLFLDEIAATDLSFQEKLLQALQTGETSSADSNEAEPGQVRVIASSSRNLEEEVAAGRFRDDLFDALQALSIVLPPLQTPSLSSELDQAIGEDWVTLSEIEGRYVARVLKHTGGNKQAAARVLSVDRKTLDRMIKRHHIIYPHARHRAKASVTS
jgi:DNA-binding NtrC family response regulator